MTYTYNAITEEHGEHIGLAYENLVAKFITGENSVKECQALIRLAPTALVDYLIWRADLHAKQEIAEAAKHDILPQPQQAVCPRCNARIKWDWCTDSFLVEKDGKFIPAYHSETFDAMFQITVKSICPCCAKTIAVQVEDEEGETTYNHPTMKDIDWELECNSHMCDDDVDTK